METTIKPDGSLSARLDTPFDDAILRVKAAFKSEGFGLLTETNVQSTLHDKIGFEMEPYTILGMCNPSLAANAIVAEPNIGLFLPCNVLVAQRGNYIEIYSQDPLIMVTVTGNKALRSIAEQARDHIGKAMCRLLCNT